MMKWLAFAAGLWLLGSSGAEAQMKGLGAVQIADVAKNRTLDLRISSQDAYQSVGHLTPSMLVHQDFGANAAVGLGLANMYQKRRGSSDQTVRSRKPAITFLMKF
jgi:hypothetical protein